VHACLRAMSRHARACAARIVQARARSRERSSAVFLGNAQAGYLLAGVLEAHPGMKLVAAREVERFLFRPGLAERARYYAVVFLNQMPLSHSPAHGAARRSSRTGSAAAFSGAWLHQAGLRGLRLSACGAWRWRASAPVLRQACVACARRLPYPTLTLHHVQAARHWRRSCWTCT